MASPANITREFIPWLKVLNQYCDESVIAEYNKLESRKKVKLLECLRGMVISQQMERAITELGAEKYKKMIEGKKKSLKKSQVDKEYVLLFDAIKCFGAKKVDCDLESMKDLVNMLKQWGVKKPKELLIMSQYFTISTLKTRETTAQKGNYWNYKSTDSAVTKGAYSSTDFTKLSKISVADLELFETAVGKFIEGVIISPPAIFVGITTFMEDHNGDHIQLLLYNMIPNSESKWELAETKFPIGAKIRIAEPFYKIFKDGNHGIRVDSPTEVQILGSNGKTFDIFQVREQGKKLMLAGDYTQALETYWEALSHFPDIVTLLNNRSQAEVKLEQYEYELLDAAAVLFLDEKNEKARHRYTVALNNLGSIDKTKKENAKSIWMKLLQTFNLLPQNAPQGEGSKEEGNRAFKSGRFEEAKTQYSAALVDCDVCLLLNNIAIACLKTEMYQTAVSAANACLRIAKGDLLKKKARFTMTKAFSMLGEIEFARFSGGTDESLRDLWADDKKPSNVLFRILESLPQFDDMGWQKTYDVGKVLQGKSIPIDYIAPGTMSHRYVYGKGRGLIATRDIHPQEVLVIDHLIYFHQGKTESNEYISNINTSTHLVDLQHRRELITKFLKLVTFDGLLVRKLILLQGCQEYQLPLITDLEWMAYRSLCYEISPFLAQTPFEVGVDAGSATFKLVESILDINIFEWGEEGSFGKRSGASLMMRVCLFNHHMRPNCKRTAIGDSMVVVANRFIKKGEELSIKYGDDVTKWGL